MDDDQDPIVCDECDLRFWLTWSNDYERSQLPVGSQIVNYCPYCGASIEIPEVQP